MHQAPHRREAVVLPDRLARSVSQLPPFSQSRHRRTLGPDAIQRPDVAPKEQRKYHRDEIGLSYNHMKNAGTALVILLLIVVVGEGVFILLSEETLEGGMEYLFLSLEGAAAVLAFLFFRLQKSVTPQKGGDSQESAVGSS